MNASTHRVLITGAASFLGGSVSLWSTGSHEAAPLIRPEMDSPKSLELVVKGKLLILLNGAQREESDA